MSRTASRSASVVLFVLVTGVAWAGLRMAAQAPAARPPAAAPGPFVASTKNGDWPSYTGDTRGTRYSPLDQINAGNFNDLEVAWRFKTDSLGTRPEYKLEGTPLVVKGVLYTTAGTRRSVIALDAATGELLWVHRYPEGTRGANAPRQLSGRGLAYWTDGRSDERIIYFTPGYRMIALDAKTGQPVKSFGKDGVVDLKVGVVFGNNQQIDLETGEIGVHSTPVVVKDVVLVGSSMKEGMTVTTHNNTKGLARGFDARTGKLLWTFNTIPRPGEFGNDSWHENSWAVNGNAGIWTQISVDEELGLVYLPVETPTSDFYGGKRPGNNLYGESLVCVDLATGKKKWHFQFVHHPLWNDDMSSAPLVADVTIDGRPRKVVAVPSKQAWLWVFDRVTGEPIWPIEEKPVPKGDVPGEWYSPTQPHPPAALMYGRNTVTKDDLIDFTPELRAQALKQLERYKWIPGAVYTPPIVGNTTGLLGAINIGHVNGGTNWPGGGYDPDTRTVFAHANTSSVTSSSVAPPPPGFSDIPYQDGVVGEQFRLRQAAGTGTYADVPQRGRGGQEGRGGAASARGATAGQAGDRGGAGRGTAAAPPAGAAAGAPATQTAEGGRGGQGRGGGGGGGGEGGGGLTVQGLSILKPPYSVLAAIDLEKGVVKWQTPHGETPDAVRSHPLLKGMNIPRTGQGASVGLVITKTLVILGESQFTTTDAHPRGAMLRAYDKVTGKEVGAVFIPAPQSGSPMTYMANGRQHIVVAVSGGPYSGEYISFALPNDAR
jgi:quinoprotein glucose dehydrogenase